jgi:hypothetical protein
MDKIDSQGMYKIHDQLPQIVQDTYESNLEPVYFKNIDHIIFVGKGELIYYVSWHLVQFHLDTRNS